MIRVDRNNIPEINQKLDLAMERAFTAIGIIGVRNVGYLTPVDSGTLKESLNFQADSTKVIIGTNVEYAVYQELGTIKMRAANKGRGFLRFAIRKSLKDFRGIINQELQSI